MTRFIKSAALAACVATGLVSVAANAAVTITSEFAGNWADDARPNKGWDIDVLTRPNGDKVLFLYSATYDADGNPMWITSNFDFKEFEFSFSGQAFGNFTGSTFSGSETPTLQLLGTMNVSVESCGEINVSLTPNVASGLQPVSQRLIPSQVLASGVAQRGDKCVYKTKFSGCPAGTTPGVQPRSCILRGQISHDMTLTNNTTWVLDGLVKVGGDNTDQTVLTIEPGTLLTGNGATSDYLYVQPGSRIIADGTAYAPIIFTSPDDGVSSGRDPAPKDWGGVVLSGNAPNNKCPAAPFDCRSEFDPNLRYGGDKPHDSSGILRYVQVRYSGYVFTEGREVNAFTMQSVGDGTVLDYLQAYRGGDDGIEFFGGTANLRHLVVTEGGDDSIDWDEGWSGKAQFAYSKTGTGFGEDNGFESSNQNENQDATPRAMPTISNFTFIGGPTAGDGIRLKEGTGGHLVNGVVKGYDKDGKACLFITNAPTYAAAGTPTALSGSTTIDHVFLNCATQFKQDDGAPWTAEAFFTAQPGNSVADAMLNGYLPMATSPVLTGGRLIEDSFFEPAPYAGAFSSAANDWTKAWTYQVQ
ncbi:hypothetical protein [Dokdonella immobilis]|uniref:MSHA biogenesis protein MshQ n=1 Tax=Dokdonella immobilis TaxID=578942 RepID=A0A1I4WYP8_9GAMM|nr:hypothetical protein [Dokdonella immobilis]SFN18099.1 hypothetical protein SAMN05216289_106144 [Dokdonella immobilis]